MKHEVFQMDQRPAGPLAAPVEAGRIAAAKRSFAIRRIDLDLAAGLIAAGAQPRAGDLVLARVETLGQHKRLEEPGGRRATLFPGDEILVAYGDRYAPDQFEAQVPETLGPCELVASGGIAASVLRKPPKVRGATGITPVGLVTDASGRRLNTRDFAMAEPSRTENMPRVVAVVGSSMNAGKTTTIAALVRGERSARRRVAGVKVTGTGSGGDLWSYRDAGAQLALDFTDAGYATTHRLPAGARVALSGPTGAGKTRLLSIIAGLERPDHGKVVIDGRDTGIRRLAALRRLVAMVGADVPLLRGTVADNIRCGARARDAEAEEILAMTG